ncbi:hypothetical protein H4R21_000813 [Coemansia helicoidea]|uniref:Uncharacterized protein n=1 Tax=Coemansia helicoidea TaxID=1286919 RepID=A0ACC1LFH2_9FUNG|nr:hypothetical protein H4R21_000813 [Coemansia helicoidea]
MVSDAYKIIEKDEAIEVDCNMITVKPSEVNIGANPSAHGSKTLDDSAKIVNNVVESCRLHPTRFDKKSFMDHMDGYLKAVTAELEKKNPKRVAGFKKDSAALLEKICAHFDEYECFTGESQDPHGMVAVLNHREDGVTPYFTFFKDGLKAVKV